MKPALDVISKLLATYFLVLPALYFGIHSWDHDHDHEIVDHYHHAQHNGTCISEEPADCLFCDLFEKHNPFFDNSRISHKPIENLLCEAYSEDHIPELEIAFLHLRGPPIA